MTDTPSDTIIQVPYKRLSIRATNYMLHQKVVEEIWEILRGGDNDKLKLMLIAGRLKWLKENLRDAEND